MCGIAGYLSERPFAEPVLERMVQRLHHRGPDDGVFYRDPPFHAGMRRLAINDLAGGRQPLFDADGTVAVLYNGEIYNHWELRRQLEAKGYRFRTRSDGEVICHLYREYGTALFERLDGMFAVALWSVPERRLVLARDIPGEKPLHYARLNGGGIAFASEIGSLLGLPGLPLTLDRQALWDFPTFLWIPEPATVWQEIAALPRSHLLIADSAGIRVMPYANRFNPDPLPDPTDTAAVVAETRRVVEQAVASRLLSDVPVGSFLSSGLDSSIVATVARRHLDRLDTFSIGFEDVADPYHGRADESAEAAAYARIIGSRHHAIRVSAADFRAELPRFCRHGDQPFAVSSGLGILAVARAAREAGIKVLLSGDGADECFGGYSWYFHLDQCGAPGPAPPPLPASAGPVSFQNVGLPLAERLAHLARLPAAERAWAWHYYAHESEKAALFAPGWGEGLEGSLRHFRAFDPAATWAAETYVAQDRAFYFPFEMLRKVDRMTMAWSVEGRVPFAAPTVLAHADKLKFAHMVGGGQLKWVLRRAFADLLPAAVLQRSKHGFNVPIDHWLRTDWADLLDEAFSEGSALFRHGLIGRSAGAAARRMLHDPRRLNGHTLFCFIMLNLWLEQTGHGNHC